jgi:hypothetical protein
MKSLRDGAAKAPPDVVSAGNAEVRQTLLLPLLVERLLERVDNEQTVTVLDVGYGVPETVTFFSRFSCRLYFAGLFDSDELTALPAVLETLSEDETDTYLETVLSQMFDVDPGVRFDICLFWDFLNCLPPTALRAFSAVLRPHLHRDTMGHGFGSFKATAPAMSRDAPERALQYGVVDEQRLVVRPRRDGLPPPYAHSRATLAEAFDCFEVARGTLLREGTMELLLKAR